MLPADYQLPAAAVLLIAGAVACFFGYRLFRVVLALVGFLLGAYVATSAVGAESRAMLVVAALGGGIAGALLTVVAYFLGVALVGAALGAAAAHVAMAAAGEEPGVTAIVLFSMAGAVASVFLERYIVVLGTAFGGAWTLVLGVLTAAGDEATRAAVAARDVWILYPLDPAPGRDWVVPAWAVLSVAGSIVQLGWTAGGRGRAPRRENGNRGK